MVTENLSTLIINKMTKAQYDRELAAGNIDENALYLIPDNDDGNDAEKMKLDSTNIAYGICSTEAATADKEISLSGNDQWSLKIGSVVMVSFTNSNSASNVKLNVNGTGAYPIWYNNAEYTSNGTAYTGYADRVTTYMFNGTHWVWIASSYDTNTTYTNVKLGHGYVKCTTATATTAKVGTLSSYTLTTGGIVAVQFTNAVPASATLNINSKGAKAMYFRGAAITGDVIKAGDVATFIYNGSQYHLLTIDRWQNDISSLQLDLDAHKADTSHITSAERINWNTAKTHADSAHAPSNAEKNQNAFSSLNFMNGTSTFAGAPESSGGGYTLSATNPTDEITFISGNGLVEFAVDDAAMTVTMTVNADPSGSADAALEDAKEYTDEKVALLLNNSSAAVDSIMELATAMEENEDVVDALEQAIGNKVDKVSGKGLSTNDLTAALKSNYDTAYSHTSNKSNPHGVTLSQLGINATTTELNYMAGATSNIQEQLDELKEQVVYIDPEEDGEITLPDDVLTTANIIDTLISTSSTSALSANQGRVLNETKVDKTYLVSVFTELKTALENNNTSGAVAILDNAILDLTTLA